MYGLAEDLDFVLQDCGVPVVYGGVTVYGIPRVEEIEHVADGTVVETPIRQHTVLIRADALSNLAIDARIVVDRVPYRILWIGPPARDGSRKLHLTPEVASTAVRSIIARLVAPIVALAGAATQRFRSSGTLATPPHALSGTADNGIFLSYFAGDPLPAGAVFTRATTATYVDVNGVVQTAAINTLRNSHYIGGVRTILLEGARTNSCRWSRDLTNAAWGFVSGAGGSRLLNAVGLDGTPNSATTLTDADSTAATNVAQNVTIPVDSNTHTLAFWVKKDTDQTRFPGLVVNITGGTNVQRLVSLNTQTGASALIVAAGTTSHRVVDAGLWWVVEITVTNNSTALNTNLSVQVYPALGATLGGNSVTPTGSCVVGQVEVNLNSAFSSSPIFTTAAAVTRAADSDLLAPPPPQSMTFYAKFTESGTALSGAFNERLLEIGSGVLPNGFWIGVSGGGLYFARFEGAAAGVQSVMGTKPTIGQTVELRATLSATGVVQISQSLDGAAETFAAASGPQPLSANWSANTLALNSDGAGARNGFNAFQSIKIARGVKSMAQMRAFTSQAA